MIAYKCDRCGRHYDTQTDGMLFKAEGTDIKQIDLCERCRESLENWLNRTAKKKQKPIEIPEVIDGFIFK